MMAHNIPRRTVINYPLTDNPPNTNWYDDNKKLVTYYKI